jgi:hypothetical protein
MKQFKNLDLLVMVGVILIATLVISAAIAVLF